MNWDRGTNGNNKTNGLLDTNNRRYNFIYSNIRNVGMENMESAPYSIYCKDMIDANILTLRFYRQACRLLPSIIHKQGNTAYMDYHQSKLNLGKWIRKSANIRDPNEVSQAIKVAYDFMFNCVTCEYESGYFNKYLVDSPETFDKNTFAQKVSKTRALNLFDEKKFKGKSEFLRKFIKGARPLMH